MVKSRAEPAGSQPPPRAPGRPRDAALDAAILSAAQEQLAHCGYAGMSVLSVAAAAGTTAPSLRRRFGTKADLATAAIAALRAVEPAPATGSARTDALAILKHFQVNLLRPHGMATLGTVLSEEHRQPELLAFYRERLVAPRRMMLRDALDRGVATGELAADTDVDATVSLLIGSYYARYLTTAGVPDDWAERVLTVVWPGQDPFLQPVS